jgi:hypothetical protein
MTSVFDFAHAAVLAMALATGPHRATPVLIDAPALITASAAHSPPDPDGTRWLDALRRFGPAVGLEGQAKRIFVTSSGRAYVPVLEERAEARSLAYDPEVSTAITYLDAEAAASELAARLGRPARFQDLAAARRLGVDAALRLILAAERRPAAPLSVLPADLAQHPAVVDEATSLRGALNRIASAALPAGARAARETRWPRLAGPAVAGWITRVRSASKPIR